MYNSEFTNLEGFNNILKSSGGYTNSYGVSQKGLYKPFTTQTTVSGVPHYESPLSLSGSIQAVSTGLNPFGPQTRNEGLIWGTGNYSPNSIDYLNDEPIADEVRTFGSKTPFHLVGWGYDIFGYPAPNYVSGWRSSGIQEISAKPSGEFVEGYTRGSHVAYDQWMAGPVDLRWDQHRKVWTANNGGIYAGTILSTYSGSTLLDPSTTATGGYYGTHISYYARIEDGYANSMIVTGSVRNKRHEKFKIFPAVSGESCLIIHYISGGRPDIGIWVDEIAAVRGC